MLTRVLELNVIESMSIFSKDVLLAWKW